MCRREAEVFELVPLVRCHPLRATFVCTTSSPEAAAAADKRQTEPEPVTLFSQVISTPLVSECTSSDSLRMWLHVDMIILNVQGYF